MLFYFEFTDMTVDGDTLTLDFSRVMAEKLACHKNEFLISFQKSVTPKAIEGGVISLYEKHTAFNTYKISHTGNAVTISMQF